MGILTIILIIAGLILILLGAFRITTPRVDLAWLGVFLVVLAWFLPTVGV